MVIFVVLGNRSTKDNLLGMEFSGRDPTGKRVMGLLQANGLATVVDIDECFLWDVPENWWVHFPSLLLQGVPLSCLHGAKSQ